MLPLFIVLSALAGLSVLVTALVNAATGVICIGVVFIVNMWMYYRRARHISARVPDLRVLSRMLEVSPGIASTGHPQRRPLRGAYRVLLTGAPGPVASVATDIVEMLLLYLKIFFLVDLLAYERITADIRQHCERYRGVYKTVGTADANLALASFRERTGNLCDAEILAPNSDAPWLAVRDGFHPLVADAVANSFVLRKPGAMVTGTNMAGKSTFLRTIGVNLILAQTAGFAFAGSYSGRALRVMSSIDKGDHLAEGRSFYYDEADRIFRMMEEVDSEVPALLLIDELLSGTNSLERESASIAILEYLAGQNALTVAATHDVAIARSVSNRYAVHFFTDHADENGLSFDYRLKKGIVETRNAIKLLRLIGYPDDVIRSAMARTEGGRTPAVNGRS